MVELTDVNDNAPAFTQSSYTAVVPENAPLDWSVSQVEALDPDEQEGGKVEYSLVNGGRLEGSISFTWKIKNNMELLVPFCCYRLTDCYA